MLCQVGLFRPEDACSRVLLIINRASVNGLLQFLRPVTPLGSQPPFSAGQSLHPYRHHYSTAFASSRSLTRCALPRTYAWATRSPVHLPSAQRAYNVSLVVRTIGVRAPLYTGEYFMCAGHTLA